MMMELDIVNPFFIEPDPFDKQNIILVLERELNPLRGHEGRLKVGGLGIGMDHGSVWGGGEV